MDNTLMFFLAGAGFTIFYGFVWRFRKKDSGPIFGYTTTNEPMAPFAVGIGIVMMLASVFVWLAGTNSP